MHGFEYFVPTEIVFGAGSTEKLPELLKKRGLSRVLVVYGGSSAKKSGLLNRVFRLLDEAGVQYRALGGVQPNPRAALAREGVQLAQESGAEQHQAVGGGSVMDCCKAISIAARYDGDVWEDFWKRPGVFDFEPLPLGVIVTVAGTGSECNGGAVITNEELKIKTGRDYPQCNPKFALLDPT